MIEMIIAIIWIHFIADFVLQSTYVATNKSRSIKCLIEHGCMYSLPFFILGIKYALINVVLHISIDFFTSKLTTRFYLREQYRRFWLVIGIDQAIHMTCLILTMKYIRLWF